MEDVTRSRWGPMIVTLTLVLAVTAQVAVAASFSDHEGGISSFPAPSPSRSPHHSRRPRHARRVIPTTGSRTSSHIAHGNAR